LAAAVALMKEQPPIAHSVSTLAALVGMSRSAFASAFRSSFGRSPMQFLTSVRLDQAADLLRSTMLPIKAIGVRVGYTSRSSFAHAFERAFGVSPRRFRSFGFSGADSGIHGVAAQLRLLSGALQDVAWGVNLITGKVWWSAATFCELGYEGRKRLISDVTRFHERIHPKERQRVVRGMQAACVAGALTWTDHFRFRKADGSYAEIENACIILRNVTGAPTRLIGVMQKRDASITGVPA
jgi:AraC-like DNA-binding protein